MSRWCQDDVKMMSRWCQDKRYEEGKRDSERYEEGKRDSESFYRRLHVQVYIYEKTCNSRTSVKWITQQQ